MQQIPLQSIPSQIIRCVLDGQNVQLSLYQKDQGLFADVISDGVQVIAGVICLDITPFVCIQYRGFRGNLMFTDTQGNSDPYYTGLSDRYALVYLTEAEYGLFQ
jgi:hypothetical protein